MNAHSGMISKSAFLAGLQCKTALDTLRRAGSDLSGLIFSNHPVSHWHREVNSVASNSDWLPSPVPTFLTLRVILRGVMR